MPPVTPAGKVCVKCLGSGPFGYDRTRREGLSVYCLPCKARRTKLDRIAAELWGEQETNNRQPNQMHAARTAVARAVKSGRLTKPDACENCDQGPIEAHHYLGYEREHWLTVRWLCRSCHHMYHKRGWAA